jgi:hypothetical protein
LSPTGNNGKHRVVVYDARKREALLDIDGVHRHFNSYGLFQMTMLLDHRYLIFPANLEQEMIYVCDLQSRRQVEAPSTKPAKPRRRIFR